MEAKEIESDAGWELHKCVFANDLRKLTQLLLISKEEIDKKVSRSRFIFT
jgi:hypothetical protein